MITVVGSVNIDVSVAVQRLFEPGETVMGQAVVSVGEKGANQAVAAAHLGSQGSLVACVGHDAFGQRAGERLEQEHTDSYLSTSASPTGLALIGRAAHGQNLIMVSPGANADLGGVRQRGGPYDPLARYGVHRPGTRCSFKGET